MATSALSDLRSLLSTHINTRNDGLTTSELIVSFRQNYGNAIAQASVDLEDIALVKLVNDVGRRVRPIQPNQLELFIGYSVPNTVVLPASDGETKGTRLKTRSMTVGQMKAWLEVHENRKSQISKNVLEMKRLLEDIAPFIEDDNTIIEQALWASKFSTENAKQKLL